MDFDLTTLIGIALGTALLFIIAKVFTASAEPVAPAKKRDAPEAAKPAPVAPKAAPTAEQKAPEPAQSAPQEEEEEAAPAAPVPTARPKRRAARED